MRKYSGYRLKNAGEVLNELKKQAVEPTYSKVVLEHVTHQYPSRETAPKANEVYVTGVAGFDGVQALTVTVDGKEKREDGSLYHITFSLAPGRKPFDSNRMLRQASLLKKVNKIKPFKIEVEEF